jgi:hypothetical protein
MDGYAELEWTLSRSFVPSRAAVHARSGFQRLDIFAKGTDGWPITSTITVSPRMPLKPVALGGTLQSDQIGARRSGHLLKRMTKVLTVTICSTDDGNRLGPALRTAVELDHHFWFPSGAPGGPWLGHSEHYVLHPGGNHEDGILIVAQPLAFSHMRSTQWVGYLTLNPQVEPNIR